MTGPEARAILRGKGMCGHISSDGAGDQPMRGCILSVGHDHGVHEDWGCEARRKLAIARGAMEEVRQELAERAEPGLFAELVAELARALADTAMPQKACSAAPTPAAEPGSLRWVPAEFARQVKARWFDRWAARERPLDEDLGGWLHTWCALLFSVVGGADPADAAIGTGLVLAAGPAAAFVDSRPFAAYLETMAETRIYELLMLLRERGGALVRAEDCPESERALAAHQGRSRLDADGRGWVWRPDPAKSVGGRP